MSAAAHAETNTITNDRIKSRLEGDRSRKKKKYATCLISLASNARWGNMQMTRENAERGEKRERFAHAKSRCVSDRQYVMRQRRQSMRNGVIHRGRSGHTSEMSAGRNNSGAVMAERRGNAEKKPLTLSWRFRREIKQRNGRSPVERARDKKGEDGVSSPREVVSFRVQGNIRIHTHRRQRAKEESEEKRKREREGGGGGRRRIVCI